MDWSKWGLSLGVVYILFFFSGWLISWLSGYLQCSKTNITENAKQGAIFGLYPVAVYAVSTYFPVIRSPFANQFMRFNIETNSSQVLGVGYLVMLMTWIATVMNINSTEKAVCNPDVNEMKEFKTKLLAELQTKQEEEEKNNEAKLDK
jgi:hypothetical protein